MEFAHLGKHCEYDTCRQRDYLPFECPACHHSFCLDHRTYEGHACQIHQQQLEEKQRKHDQHVAAQPRVNINPHRCSFPSCRTRELQPNPCRNCHRNHCLKHRFPTSHACTASTKNHIAKAGTVAYAAPTSTSTSSSTSTTSTAESCAAAQRRTQQPSGNSNVGQLSRLLKGS